MIIDNKLVYIHSHFTDELKKVFVNIRGKKNQPNFKMVIFIDDLDRCFPQTALEIIESIKSFLDIEGLVYVIGLNPSNLDNILKEKFADKSQNINDKVRFVDHYLEKIIQVPFFIPLWTESDLSNFLINLIKQLDKKIQKEFTPLVIKMIVKTVKNNPRQIKRFLNYLILTYFVISAGRDKSENSFLKFDQLTVVRALEFRNDWNEFLELIRISNNFRISFFSHFLHYHNKYVKLHGSGNSFDILLDILEKNIDEENKNNEFTAEILETYKKLKESNNLDLIKFLKDSGGEILFKISDLEEFVRASQTIQQNVDYMSEKEFSTEELLDMLTYDIKKFNEVKFKKYSEESIDLSYANLKNLDLSGVFLANSILEGINFTGSFLRGANLRSSKLKDAILVDTDLRESNLRGVNLTNATLYGATLSNAYLIDAKLNKATLSGAKLNKTKLLRTELTGINIKNAIFEKCVIFIDDTKKVEQVETDSNTRFMDCVTDSQMFINILKSQKVSEKYLPALFKNKSDLRNRLKELKYNEDEFTYILGFTHLKESDQ